MKTDRIFIGNIKMCTKCEFCNVISNNDYIDDKCIGSASFGYIDYEEKIVKENAILIKLKDYFYVDIENLNSFLDYILISGVIINPILTNLAILTAPYKKNQLFVDKESLKPYYGNEEKIDNISLKTLKKNLKK